MAFSKTNFSPVGANAKRGVASQLFSYRTADAAAVVLASGYFNEISSMLAVGDRIDIIVVDDPDAPTSQTDFINAYVASNASGVVDANVLATI